jgi:V/A-type H+-transporting ATPase subunit K
MGQKTIVRIGKVMVVLSVLLMGMTLWAMAQGGEAGANEAAETALPDAVKAIGAGLAFLGGAIGTGLAQSRIIAAVLGAVAEDPGQLGFGIFLIAFPETILILGFVMAFILQ